MAFSWIISWHAKVELRDGHAFEGDPLRRWPIAPVPRWSKKGCFWRIIGPSAKRKRQRRWGGAQDRTSSQNFQSERLPGRGIKVPQRTR